MALTCSRNSTVKNFNDLLAPCSRILMEHTFPISLIFGVLIHFEVLDTMPFTRLEMFSAYFYNIQNFCLIFITKGQPYLNFTL